MYATTGGENLMRNRICRWSQVLSAQDATRGKTVTSQWRNLATILTE